MKRSASAIWQGALRDGSGTVSTETGVLSSVPYSFTTRFEDGKNGTNPEELLGAAHAACFAMAFSHESAEAGYPVEKAETTATVTIDQVEGGFEIPSVHLVLTATIPGLSQDEFQTLANKAKEHCPLSKVLNATITLDATLHS